jgi:hypothetical protein
MPKNDISNRQQACLELIGDDDSELLFVNGHDDAIIGIVEREGIPLVVYDTAKIINLLRTRDRMSRDEAEEFFEYNVAGAWMGEQTPLFLRRIGR